MTYVIFYESSTKKDTLGLGQAALKVIQKVIEDRLVTNPVHHGKPLRRSLKGHRRLRIGDYRVIYRIDEVKKSVHIVAIGHRKDIYKD